MRNFFKRIFFSNKKEIDKFWIQGLKVCRIENRLDLFRKYLENKKVLHVGCTDFPIFSVETNLHLQISGIASELHGMDVDMGGLDELKTYYDGKYFSSFDDISENYDVVLVPETIEHVENVKKFLNDINLIKSDVLIISGPNCFNKYFSYGFSGPHVTNKDNFVEYIHPDHNCWFSPYTLKNVVQKYTNYSVKDIFLTNHDLSVVCICFKNE